jgi:peptide/nickel transport system permease protein
MATTQDAILVPSASRRSRPFSGGLRLIGRFCLQKPLGAFGAAILLITVALALFAPEIARYPYDQVHLSDLLQPPSAAHFFGTDENGRDMFSRIVFGAQVTVIVGFGSVLLTALLATTIGVVSAYAGGVVDLIVQRVVDVWMSFPALFLLLTVVAVLGTGGGGFFGLGRGPHLGPSIRGVTIIVSLGLILAGGASRVIRSSVLTVKANQYIEAARVLGSSDTRIVLRYILPNVFPVIIVLSTVQLGVAVLAEATISFLGFGIPPPFPTWGQMLSGRARELGPEHPWLVLFPGLAIFLAVYGFNMLGDALRDVLDPRMRGAR